MKLKCSVLVALIALLSLALSSCHKDTAYMNNAVITGVDLRMCACCGGLMLNFNNNPTPVYGRDALVENSPESLGINMATVTFPIYMRVNWRYDSNTCGGSHIIITNYEQY